MLCCNVSYTLIASLILNSVILIRCSISTIWRYWKCLTISLQCNSSKYIHCTCNWSMHDARIMELFYVRLISQRIDSDSDGYITHEELKQWVEHVSDRYVLLLCGLPTSWNCFITCILDLYQTVPVWDFQSMIRMVMVK